MIKGRFIKSKNPDKASTFLIRRIASGVGVERIFPFFSPSIESIKLNRKGKVRQARIYYMRENELEKGQGLKKEGISSMPILPILTFPNSLLRKKAKPVKIIDDELKDLILI